MEMEFSNLTECSVEAAEQVGRSWLLLRRETP